MLDVVLRPCPFADKGLLEERYPPLPVCRIAPAVRDRLAGAVAHNVPHTDESREASDATDLGGVRGKRRSEPWPVLVWGGRVVERLRALGANSCAVRWFDMDAADAVRLLLDYEHRPDGLTMAEAARLLTFCDRVGVDVLCAEHQDICKRVFPRGGFPHEVRRYLALADELRSLVSDGELDIKSALLVEQLAPRDRYRLFPVLRRLKPNQARVLVRRVVELAHRAGVSRETQDPAGSNDQGTPALFLDAVVGAEDPLFVAERLWRPELSALEERFSELRRSLTQGAAADDVPVIGLEAPDYFEGDAFTISFAMRKPEDVRRAAAQLVRLQEQTAELEELCELLGT